MQGLQVASAVNDENMGIGNGPATAFKENACLQTSKQTSTLKSARKAFGNITNTQPRESRQPGTVKRRAFGADISNSTSKPTAKKADALPLKPSSIQPAQVLATEAPAAPAPWWESVRPERSAGKTWEQLQADRENEEDADVERSVQQLLAGMRNITARVLKVYVSDSDDEDLIILQPRSCRLPELSQPVAPLPASPPSTSGVVCWSLVDDDIPLEQLLPDVELPELDLDASATAAPEPGTTAAAETTNSTGGQSASARSTSSTASTVNMSQQQSTVSDEVCDSPQQSQRALQSIGAPKSPDPLPW